MRPVLVLGPVIDTFPLYSYRPFPFRICISGGSSAVAVGEGEGAGAGLTLGQLGPPSPS